LAGIRGPVSRLARVAAAQNRCTTPMTNMSFPRLPRSAFAVLTALAMSGCAVVQVRGVGTATGQPAYDLVGPSLESLSAEAVRLCPQGHAVMRQWQRGIQPVGAADPTQGWAAAASAFSYDLPPEQAQMSIVCQPRA
jgi:hypothetical protein